MSAAPRSKTTVWYKEHYDKICVVVVLVALLASALFLLLQITQARRALSDVQWTRVDVDHNQYKPRDVTTFGPFVERLESPFAIADYTNQLLVSDLRVVSVNPDVRTPIPYGAEVCPWTQYPQPAIGSVDTTGDGIPDDWYMGYGLDPFDPTIPGRDLDGDGFTVREEFDAGTSPVDAADHPSYAYKLRVLRVATRPFDLRFQGVQEIAPGDERYHLNVRGRDRSYFAKIGEIVEGYKIAEFERRSREGQHGRPLDVSVLTLERGDGRRVELVINRDVTLDDRVAELLFLVDDSTHRVNVGDELTLLGNVYNVIDIRQDTVLIRDQSRQVDVTVGRRTQADMPSTEPTPPGESRLDAFFEGLNVE